MGNMAAEPRQPSPEQAASLRTDVDAACAEAAEWLAGADVLLLATGAGFSADSGLAVYGDLAQVPAYATRGLTYSDLSRPPLLHQNPELFWGFWGQSFNDYRDTAPHVGYEIIHRWAEERFRHSEVGEVLRQRLSTEQIRSKEKEGRAVRRECTTVAERDGSSSAQMWEVVFDLAVGIFADMDQDSEQLRLCKPGERVLGVQIGEWLKLEGEPGFMLIQMDDLVFMRRPDGEVAPYEVDDFAGAFFAFTSNIDAHHFDWFEASEIRECHGNIEMYQTVRSDGTWRLWRAPMDFRFTVDAATLLAPADATPARMTAVAQNPSSATDAVPRIGSVRRSGRPHLLRHMRGACASSGFERNHPVCPSTGDTARPAVLMFGDEGWQDLRSQEQRWERWQAAVEQLAAERAAANSQPLRVMILEIGAGGNVTTVRRTMESCLSSLHAAGAHVRLFRINPALPLGDDQALAPGGEKAMLCTGIMATGLDSIRKIQDSLQRFQ